MIGAAGAGLAFTPFVPFGNFMPNPSIVSFGKTEIYLESTKKQANVNTVPVNYGETISYPRTKDPVLDAEPFRKWQFIRLPEGLGGAENDVSSFRIYSNICLHLWCLWEYKTDEMNGACPCHGSIYDIRNGRSIAGPASVQAEPSNVLPFLGMEIDSDGMMWILPPTFNADSNGIVGYGRFL